MGLASVALAYLASNAAVFGEITQIPYVISYM